MVDTGAEANFIGPDVAARLGATVEKGVFGLAEEAFGALTKITGRTTLSVNFDGQHAGSGLKGMARTDINLLVAPKPFGRQYDVIVGMPFQELYQALIHCGKPKFIQLMDKDGNMVRVASEEPDAGDDLLVRAIGRRGAYHERCRLLGAILSEARIGIDQLTLDTTENRKKRRQEDIELAERAATDPELKDCVMSLADLEAVARDETQTIRLTPMIHRPVRPEEKPEDPGLLPTDERADAERRLKIVLRDYVATMPDDLPNLAGIATAESMGGGVKIITADGAQPIGRYGPRQTPEDTAEAARIIKILIDKGYIRPSSSPWGSPMFLVAKPDGTRRMVIDYRALNSVTVRNRYPLPKVDELFDQLLGARYFSKLDLRTGYWQIRMHEDSVAKTAFTSRHGHFEWLVLPMGLTNAPAEFMRMMETTFSAQLNKSVMVFLDDILIYSKTMEEHEKHLRAALKCCADKKLFIKQSKCQFFRQEVEFLGHYVGRSGIRMVEDKVRAVEDWPAPTRQKEVERFIGLAGYYRRFIKDFSKISAPLTELCGTLKKVKGGTAARTPPKKKFVWGEDQRKAFEEVKRAVTSAPCLTLPDPDKPFIVHTDASGYATGAVLMQKFEDGLKPIAFLSKKMRAAEKRYPVHEQELLAILNALKAWKHYLGGRRFTVWTDHQSLQYLESSTNATPRQLRWAAWLSEFDFAIKYAPGEKNVAADAMSRIDEPIEEEQRAEQSEQYQLATTWLCALADIGPLPVRIRQATTNDPSYQQMLLWSAGQLLRTKKMEKHDGLLYKLGGQLVVPDSGTLRAWLLSWAHDADTGAHRSGDRTFEWLKERVWWAGMRDSAGRYVSSCETCQRAKPDLKGRQGKPRSIETPSAPGEWLSMDFVGPFTPSTKGCNSIMVVVDRLTRYVFFIPCKTTDTAQDIWKLLDSRVLTHTGIPRAIVSDRDTKFTSHFWEALWAELHTILKRSTAFHPQTDGQSERAVRTLVEALRATVDVTQDNWEELLPSIARAFNSAKCEVTGTTPDLMFFGSARRSAMDAELEGEDIIPVARYPGALQVVKKVKEAIKASQEAILTAQAKQRKDSEKSRIPVTIKVGDMVWLSNRNLRPVGEDRTRKLDPLYYGPYKVLEMHGENAVKLELPKNSRLHPVFNTDLLRPVKTDSEFEARPQDNDRPGPIPEEDPAAAGPASLEPSYEVEAIIGKKLIRGKEHFHVKWSGWPIEQASWEPREHCSGAEDLILQFEQRAVRRSPRRVQVQSISMIKTRQKSDITLAAVSSAQPSIGSEEAKKREWHKKNTLWNRMVEPNAPEPKRGAGGEIDMGAQRCVADTKIGGWCKQHTKNGCLCWIHRAQLDGTQIKKSTIPNAGKGLFAKKDFGKGDAIVRYTGDMVKTENGEKPEGFKNSHYVLELSEMRAIDAARTNAADGRLINSPKGFPQARANCRFAADHRRGIVTIRAQRKIKKGEELFINYGRNFSFTDEIPEAPAAAPAQQVIPAAPLAPKSARGNNVNWGPLSRRKNPGDNRNVPIMIDGLRVYRLSMMGFNERVGYYEDEYGPRQRWTCYCVPSATVDNTHSAQNVPYCTECNTNSPARNSTTTRATTTTTEWRSSSRSLLQRVQRAETSHQLVTQSSAAASPMAGLRTEDTSMERANSAQDQRTQRARRRQEDRQQQEVEMGEGHRAASRVAVSVAALAEQRAEVISPVPGLRTTEEVLAMLLESPSTQNSPEAIQLPTVKGVAAVPAAPAAPAAVGGAQSEGAFPRIVANRDGRPLASEINRERLAVSMRDREEQDAIRRMALQSDEYWHEREQRSDMILETPAIHQQRALEEQQRRAAAEAAQPEPLTGKEMHEELYAGIANQVNRLFMDARPNRLELQRRYVRWAEADLYDQNIQEDLPGVNHEDNGSSAYKPSAGLVPSACDCHGVAGKKFGSREERNKVYRVPARKEGFCRRTTCECCAPRPALGHDGTDRVFMNGHWCSCMAIKDGLCRRCYLDHYYVGGTEREHNVYYPQLKNEV